MDKVWASRPAVAQVTKYECSRCLQMHEEKHRAEYCFSVCDQGLPRVKRLQAGETLYLVHYHTKNCFEVKKEMTNQQAVRENEVSVSSRHADGWKTSRHVARADELGGHYSEVTREYWMEMAQQKLDVAIAATEETLKVLRLKRETLAG